MLLLMFFVWLEREKIWIKKFLGIFRGVFNNQKMDLEIFLKGEVITLSI